MKTITETQIVEKAKRKLGFKIHFVIFLLTCPINWVIWFFTDTTYVWPIWPTLGWGIGILFHWLGVQYGDYLFSFDKA
jgi:hypothetical protein